MAPFDNPYVPYVLDAADQYGVPRPLALKLANQESGFNPRAVSSAGAIGLTQLEPGTAKDLGVNPWDPQQNAQGGMRYLRSMLDKFKSVPLALAAYNAGPGRVSAYLNGSSGLPSETLNYVSSIQGASLPTTQNKGNTMAQKPALSTALTGGSGALFGGDNGNGFASRLGSALQSLGAGMIAPYNPAGAAALMAAEAKRDGTNKYGLNPVWAKDPNGNYIPLQLNAAGGVRPVQLPNGLSAVLPTTTIDLGNRIGVMRRGDVTPAVVMPKAGPVGTDEQPTIQNGNITGYEAVPGSQTAGKITPRETRERGQKGIEYTLGHLTDAYTQLHDNGGISGPANGIADNVKNAEAFISNSGVGQAVGKLFGTANQSTRNTINSLRPALINAIRSSTGMSARAMDSDTELKFYMQQATDPQNDYLSNLAAIENLDNQYGLGGVLKQHLPPVVYKQVQQRAAVMRQEHPFSSANDTSSGGDNTTMMPNGITIRRIK